MTRAAQPFAALLALRWPTLDGGPLPFGRVSRFVQVLDVGPAGVLELLACGHRYLRRWPLIGPSPLRCCLQCSSVREVRR